MPVFSLLFTKCESSQLKEFVRLRTLLQSATYRHVTGVSKAASNLTNCIHIRYHEAKHPP